MQVAVFLNQHKNKLLNIALFIFALFLAGRIYRSQIHENDMLVSQIQTEKQKNTIIDDIFKQQKSIDYFVNAINNKDISLAINTIGSIARMHSVELKSVRPTQKKESDEYEVYPFSFSVNTDSYHKLGKFVAKLESHPDIYLIERAQISSVPAKQKNETVISGEFIISTIVLKDTFKNAIK